VRLGDVRDTLYGHYVSLFKGEYIRGEEGVGWSRFSRWCELRYLPLLAGVPKTARVLEVGAGAGEVLRFLNGFGFTNTVGIDVSAEQSALATKNGVSVMTADVFEFLPEQNREWDVIIAIDFMEHFTREESLRLAYLFHSALVEGGLLLIQTVNGSGLLAGQVTYGDLTHMTIFTPTSLAQVLRPQGFGHFSFYETGPVPDSLLGVGRVLGWRLVKMIANSVRRIEAWKRQDVWTENFICTCHAGCLDT
jgi:SAM-dependent methyltransferase